MTIRKLVPLAALFAAAAAPVAAQDEAAEAGEFEALKACRDITNDTQRLACFDRAMGVVVAAEESGNLRVVDKEAAEQTRRRLFGFSLPDLGLFGGDDEELELLETTITSVRRIRRDAYIFKTEEGATWQIQNMPSRTRPPQVGQSVVFRKASLGSYFIRINGQMGVKGRRVG